MNTYKHARAGKNNYLSISLLYVIGRINIYINAQLCSTNLWWKVSGVRHVSISYIDTCDYIQLIYFFV